MKIVLTPEAVSAVKKLQDRIKIKNEFAQKRFSPVVSQVVVSALTVFTDVQIDLIASALVSPEGQKKVRLKRLEKLVEELGEDSISKLERSLKRNKNV
jgi:L-cystine uptake protein TcyP (sodium:dicarboxylate symporter family)